MTAPLWEQAIELRKESKMEAENAQNLIRLGLIYETLEVKPQP
jgi:hypothetical protein